MNLKTAVLAAKGKRSWRQFSAELGVSHSYVYNIAYGTEKPSDRLLALLGLERVVTYRKSNGKK